MTRPSRARVLAEIVKVRDVQERAAQQAVARINGELRTLADEKTETMDQLCADQSAWNAAINGPMFDPGVAAAWAATVIGGGERVRDVENRISQAEDRKAEGSRDWRAALARSDVAHELARKARRHDQRSREETALADLADRIAAGGGRE